MEVGIPQRLETPVNTITFNVETANGMLLLQEIAGMSGAPIRNPYTHRPHSHGAILHRFQRGPKIFQVSGLIVAKTLVGQQLLEDQLRTGLEAILQAGVFGHDSTKDGKYVWQPVGATERYHYVHAYEPLLVTGPSASPGTSPSGIAAPKIFSFTLIAEEAYARGNAQSISITNAGVVPNNGNAPSWPVFQVYAGASGWGLFRDDGFGLTSQGILGQHGAYINVDMFRQTMYWNSGANALGDLDMGSSDFFEILPGGASIFCDVPVLCLAEDAWVG